ncbi:uncharacterized protein LOC103956978 [Pyrus x bretschneideri]|uniref:uncharacterized protein LOC103956978 n=1 Tax=Pyrus x bretschneideri TaxID=225117 RepID=UPI00202E7820|nr:uncharacterized protein LOC103956978 [Pyrus x bretschneideri]
MLKSAQSVRQTASKIKIAYDSRYLGAVTSQQHSSVVSSCGVVIRQNFPVQWQSWAEIPKETKKLVQDKLSVIYDLQDISLEAMAYLEETLATRYKHWKNNLHMYFKRWDDPKIAHLHGPIELQDQLEDWEWLCKHFTDPKFVKKYVVGMEARESKTLLHHFDSKSFSYRLKARRQEGSKFLDIDMLEDVYVRPGDEITEQLHAVMVEKRIAVLQEATSHLPSKTPIKDVMNFSRRHGKVVRYMGKAQVSETGAFSSRSNIAKVDALKEEVTTLKGQLAVQGEQIRT